MRIVFLTRTLDRAGAQRQLVLLARGLKARQHDVSVIVLYPGGPFTSDLEDAGIQVINLRRSGRWDLLRIIKSVNDVVTGLAPDVIHGYLETPNILAAIAGRRAGVGKIIFGIRASRIDYRQYDWAIRIMNFLERRYSRFATSIIVNAQATEKFLRLSGYPPEKIEVIPNGIDTRGFTRDLVRRASLRTKWGIPLDVPVVGIVARFDPKKDHRCFLEAASIVHRLRPEVHFVSAGIAEGDGLERFKQMASEYGLSGKISLVSPESDVAGIYSALDVLCSSSAFGEGFPNVIAEAMSCGLPVVATDCGDSAYIVGDTGIIVPIADARSLANGLLEILSQDRGELGRRARQRIEENFAVERLIDGTERVLLGEGEKALAGSALIGS